jgi:hypothetical protein
MNNQAAGYNGSSVYFGVISLEEERLEINFGSVRSRPDKLVLGEHPAIAEA